MSKGPTAFRTISEVADELDLPQHVLRFWETRFTQIRPMKRGGGRRYYRPDDIELLRGIRHLLYGEGYTIRGVQRILKEHGPRFVTGAGRGDLTDLPPRTLADEEDGEPDLEPMADAPEEREDPEIGDGDTADPDTGDEPRHVEPTFDPRAFRPSAPAETPAEPRSIYARPIAGLGDDVSRLNQTLGELLELKRILDTARD